jgi:hypothetical protein
LMTRTTQAVLQANSIRAQLQKLSESNPASKTAVAEFQKKLDALLGAQGGSPSSQETSLTRVSGDAGTLYQQIWTVDAEPTSSQIEALHTTEGASSELLKRWTEMKNSSVPELNRVLRESQAPEVRVEDHPAKIETSVDEE